MKIINLIIIFLLFVFSYILLPYLPDQIPMHWNIRGEIDSYWPKSSAVWFLPSLVLVIYILFQITPAFDPNKEKYKLFTHEWEIIKLGLISFFTYLQFIIFCTSLNPKVQMMPLMFIGLGVLFILLGNYMSKIRQNWFIGIKVPWTLSNEENWNLTHRYASWCFVIAGIVIFAEAYFIWYAPVIIFGSIILASFLPIIYSFLIFKKSVHLMKYVYIAILVLFMGIFSLRFISGEDDWICQNGSWIKHGKPSMPQPKYPCK